MITVKCNECGKEFEAQRTSAKFCSANCRVKFNNKLGDLADKVTTADKIETTEYKVKVTKDFDMKVNPIDTTIKINIVEWIKEIEAYCEKGGITPEDLILSHKERFKAKKGAKGINGQNTEDKQNLAAKKEQISHSNWFKDYKKSKTGISE